MSTIWFHGEKDWCHICGERGSTADIWFPENAEAALKQRVPKESNYIRICSGCSYQISKTIEEGEIKCRLNPNRKM